MDLKGYLGLMYIIGLGKLNSYGVTFYFPLTSWHYI